MGALIVLNHAVEDIDSVLSVMDAVDYAGVKPTNPQEEVIECLKTYKAIDEASAEMNSNNFETLRSVLSRFTEHKEAETFLTDSEVAWIEGNFKPEEIKRSKAGKIFVTKHLPGSYVGAKAVLLKALENGIAFYDENGEPVGKTALQNSNKGAKKTAEEKILAMMESVMKILPDCENPEAMRAKLQEIVA